MTSKPAQTDPLLVVRQALGGTLIPESLRLTLPAVHRRLVDALSGHTGGHADLAVLIRHVLGWEDVRGNRLPVLIPESLIAGEALARSGLDVLPLKGGRSEVSLPPADRAGPVPGDALREVYREELVRLPDEVPSDPFWRRVVGYDTYQSHGQKQIARSLMLCPPGGTVIATLPHRRGQVEPCRRASTARQRRGGDQRCRRPHHSSRAGSRAPRARTARRDEPTQVDLRPVRVHLGDGGRRQDADP